MGGSIEWTAQQVLGLRSTSPGIISRREREHQVLAVLRAAGRPLFAADIAQRAGLGRWYVAELLRALRDRGEVTDSYRMRPAGRGRTPSTWEAVR